MVSSGSHLGHHRILGLVCLFCGFFWFMVCWFEFSGSSLVVLLFVVGFVCSFVFFPGGTRYCRVTQFEDTIV